MIIIKRFIDRVSASEGKIGTNVILPMEEARMLRDELAKLLSDNYDLLNNKKESIDNSVIQVEVNGGKWS
jgi:hypothetical protein